MAYTIKSTQKLDLDISGSLDKPKTLGHCGFPLANLQKGSVLDFVPKSSLLIQSILLYICSANLKSVRLSSQLIEKFSQSPFEFFTQFRNGF